MALGTSGGASHFTDKREQNRTARDNSAPPMRHPLSPPSERGPAHSSRQNGLKFPPEPDIACRRQLSRREKGDELRIVGPPIIYNPNELPFKKRSMYTLIEKAQSVFQDETGEDIASLAAQVACAHLEAQPRGMFDDTASISTDPDYTDHEMNYNSRPVALGTDYNKGNPASNPNLKLVNSEHANLMRGEINGEEGDEGYVENQYPRQYQSDTEPLPNWREEADAEREYRRNLATSKRQDHDHAHWGYSTRLENHHSFENSSVDFNDDEDGGYDGYDHQLRQGDHFEGDDIDPGARTPTQPESSTNRGSFQPENPSEERLAIPRSKAHIRNKELATDAGPTENAKCAMPIPSHGKIVNQAKTVSTQHQIMGPRTKTANASNRTEKQPAQITIPMRSASPPKTFGESKATSFGSSSPSQNSEDELALPDPAAPMAHKRNFEASLDYPREQLTEMAYSDLESKPFITDPNEPPREPARGQHGIELSLEQKLSKMTDMTEEQCKAMFEAMTDAETEGTGEWFTQMVKEDMSKLMRAKHRRRMVALKFEYEVKRRNALVNAKKHDVEEELAGLRNGLGNLMPVSISASAAEKKDRREQAKTATKTAK